MIAGLIAALLTLPPSPRVVDGPRLEAVTETSAVVVWTTDVPTEGLVRFGPRPSQLDRTFGDGLGLAHRVTLMGLEPGAPVVYAVGTPEQVLAGGDFGHVLRTVPPAGTAFRAWVTGNTAADAELLRGAMEASLGFGWPVAPAVALHLGGIRQPLDPGRYDVLTRTVGLRQQGGPAYSFQAGDAHVVVLDTGGSVTPDDPLLDWLAADLGAADRRWRVAALFADPLGPEADPSLRDLLMPALEAAGVDLVLSADPGGYRRSLLLHGGEVLDAGSGEPHGNAGPYVKSADAPGTVYVACGLLGGVSGADPRLAIADPVPGACLLDVDPRSLSVTHVRTDGLVGDRVSLVLPDQLLVVAPNGGETLPAGQPTPVRWVAPGVSGNVTVETTLDGGETWSAVGNAPAAAGELTWNLPGRSALDVRVRVRGADGLGDASDGAAALQAGEPLVEVPFGAQWRVYDGPEDPGLAIAAASFDDGDWAEVLTPVSGEHTTLFARYRLTLEALPAAGVLQVRHDDGLVVWINGQEIARRHVGDLEAGAFARRPGADRELTRLLLPIRTGGQPFVLGDNVVAVMIKRATDERPPAFDAALTLFRRGTDVPIPAGGDEPDPEVAPLPPDAERSEREPAQGCGPGGPAPAAAWIVLVALLLLQVRTRGLSACHRKRAGGPRPRRR